MRITAPQRQSPKGQNTDITAEAGATATVSDYFAVSRTTNEGHLSRVHIITFNAFLHLPSPSHRGLFLLSFPRLHGDLGDISAARLQQQQTHVGRALGGESSSARQEPTRRALFRRDVSTKCDGREETRSRLPDVNRGEEASHASVTTSPRAVTTTTTMIGQGVSVLASQRQAASVSRPASLQTTTHNEVSGSTQTFVPARPQAVGMHLVAH